MWYIVLVAGEKPIKLNIENNVGQTPLFQALNKQHKEICKLLIYKGGKFIYFIWVIPSKSFHT